MSITSNSQKLRNRQHLQVIRYISWVFNLIFLVALIVAIYQAIVNRNPLPIWAWLGLVVLFAVAIGIGVAVIVYRGVVKQFGPFDHHSGHPAGALKSEARRVDTNGATSLRTEIKMMAGDLQLMGGTKDVMDASFSYDDADWKPPVVDFAVDAEGQGALDVEQKSTGRPAMRQGPCEWVVRLNQALPTELKVKLGAGKAGLRLGNMMLDRLQIESGVGELDLDLSGEWKRSLEGYIKAGIGDTNLRLPQNIGVRIQSTVGFGSIKPHGLTWDGEAYVNALYGQVAVNLDLTVESGMGKINIQ